MSTLCDVTDRNPLGSKEKSTAALKQHYKNNCHSLSVGAFQNILLTCSTLRTNPRMMRICCTNHYFCMSKISQLHRSQLPSVRSDTNRFCWQRQVFILAAVLAFVLVWQQHATPRLFAGDGGHWFFFFSAASLLPPTLLFPPGFWQNHSAMETKKLLCDRGKPFISAGVNGGLLLITAWVITHARTHSERHTRPRTHPCKEPQSTGV